MPTEGLGFFLGVAGLVAVVIVLLVMGYLKAPPDTAFVISGLRKRRVLIGKAGLRIPFFERLDKISLRVMQVDIKTAEAVPTKEFINVKVDGVANIKVSSNPQMLERASEALLNLKIDELRDMITQVMEGNMREIVGSMGLREMVQDRKEVAEKVFENAIPDMAKLGIEIVNFNIQSFKDENNTIENLGIDNIERIRKDAQIAKAQAARDIAIEDSKAKEAANAVRVDADKRIAGQNAELVIQQAEMKKKADIKLAEADAAYNIQKEEQRKTIEITSANADIAKREKEVEIATAEIEVKEKRLDAEIRKTADANRYKVAQEAEAELIKRQKNAEAERYEKEQEALARKAAADADMYARTQEAAGIRAVGLAEAEAIDKKAEAMRKMGEASILEMYFNVLPAVVQNIAAPLSQTDKIVMYGDGNASRLVGDVMKISSQIFEGLKESAGIDLADVINNAVLRGMAVKNDVVIPPSEDIALEQNAVDAIAETADIPVVEAEVIVLPETVE